MTSYMPGQVAILSGLGSFQFGGGYSADINNGAHMRTMPMDVEVRPSRLEVAGGAAVAAAPSIATLALYGVAAYLAWKYLLK